MVWDGMGWVDNRVGRLLTQSVAMILSSKSISILDSRSLCLPSLLSAPEIQLVGFRATIWRVSWAYVR